MIRDNNCSEEVYSQTIHQLEEDQTKFEEQFYSDDLKNKAIFNFVKSEYLLMILQVRYCRGDNLSDLKKSYEELLKIAINSITKTSIYDYVLSILSLGILFNANKTDLIRFYEALKVHDINDFLLSFLANSLDPSISIENSLLFKTKVLSQLRRIAKESKNENSDLVKKILDEDWYTIENLEDECHTEDLVTYRGYYAWAVAAVVKIKKIDDSSFKDSPYYPTDLVHWQQ